MIYGIGTDLVDLARMEAVWQKWGNAAIKRFLSQNERADFENTGEKSRFLAKRFAAKEAFAKAVGTGLRGAVCLQNISIFHDELGKPYFIYAEALQDWLNTQKISHVHLSLSDEERMIIAFAIAEK